MLTAREKWIKEETERLTQKGHEILDEKYWEKYDEIVPIRLDGIYEGFDLKASLGLCEFLNSGGSLEKAKEIIESQDHTGITFYLVLNEVMTFCDRGREFAEYVDPEWLAGTPRC